ncbi:MAG: hypothetical protein QG673_338 [Pseudomonadota bacterium]|nr:hypothetical protein [Pseudomonadota bacterium]
MRTNMKTQTSGTGLVQRIFSVGQLLSNNNVSENVFKLLQRYSGTSEISPSGAQRTMSVTQTQFSEDEPENW